MLLTQIYLVAFNVWGFNLWKLHKEIYTCCSFESKRNSFSFLGMPNDLWAIGWSPPSTPLPLSSLACRKRLPSFDCTECFFCAKASFWIHKLRLLNRNTPTFGYNINIKLYINYFWFIWHLQYTSLTVSDPITYRRLTFLAFFLYLVIHWWQQMKCWQVGFYLSLNLLSKLKHMQMLVLMLEAS